MEGRAWVLAGLCIALLCTPGATWAQQQFLGEDAAPDGLFPREGDSARQFRRFSRHVRNQRAHSFESSEPGQRAPFEVDLVGPSGTTPVRLVGDGEVAESPSDVGFARTGSRHWQATPGSFTLTFGHAVPAIGIFASNVGDEGGRLELRLAGEDGSIRKVRLENTTFQPPGSVLFFGIVSRSETWSSITFQTTAPGEESFAIDDVVVGDTR